MTVRDDRDSNYEMGEMAVVAMILEPWHTL